MILFPCAEQFGSATQSIQFGLNFDSIPSQIGFLGVPGGGQGPLGPSWGAMERLGSILIRLGAILEASGIALG